MIYSTNNMQTLIKTNRLAIISAIVLMIYFFSLSLIQTQWAFYLSANFIMSILIAMSFATIQTKGFMNNLVGMIIYLPVLAIGMYSRFSLDQFDTITDGDDFLINHTVFYFLSLLIPFGVVLLLKPLLIQRSADSEINLPKTVK